MLWILMALLVLVGAASALRRRRHYESQEDEPWRASLDQSGDLDLDEIRRAEEEWLAEDAWNDSVDDEDWR